MRSQTTMPRYQQTEKNVIELKFKHVGVAESLMDVVVQQLHAHVCSYTSRVLRSRWCDIMNRRHVSHLIKLNQYQFWIWPKCKSLFELLIIMGSHTGLQLALLARYARIHAQCDRRAYSSTTISPDSHVFMPFIGEL